MGWLVHLIPKSSLRFSASLLFVFCAMGLVHFLSILVVFSLYIFFHWRGVKIGMEYYSCIVFTVWSETINYSVYAVY